MSLFEGSCNRCGLCCFGPDGIRCENLVITGEPGKPFATACKVYESRYDGMEILMVDPDGTPRALSVCSKESADEDRMILEKGIGRGCSLRVIGENAPLMTFIRR